MLAQGNFDFHAGVSVITENFGHARDRLGILRRLCDQFDHHDLTTLCAAVIARLNQNILADTLVFGHDKEHAALRKEAPYQLVVLALKHLDDRALTATATVYATSPHHRTIAIEHPVHLLGTQKKII